jgi:hypothetical protein
VGQAAAKPSPDSIVFVRRSPCKHVFHIQVSLFTFLSTLPIRLKLGQQIRGGLLIANHLDQLLLWWGQSETRSSSTVRSYLLHSFLQVHSVAAPFTTSHLANCAIMYAELKTTNFLNQTGMFFFTFLHPIWLVLGSHILSTASGDALRPLHQCLSSWPTLQKHFSASRCETTNSKPLGPIKLSSQSETESSQ